MRLFAPTIRSLHVLALVIFSSVTRLPYSYGMLAAYHGPLPLTRRVRLIVDLLVGPVTWHVFPSRVPRGVPMTRHQRDLIRRRIRMLLTVLGDTPDAIQATLCRLHSFGDFSPAPEWHTPLEQYLYVRTGCIVDIRRSLITVDNTFEAATPKNIRRYLASASYTNHL